MKKGIILLGILSLTALASCSKQSSAPAVSNASIYHHYTLSDNEGLKDAIEKVDSANITLGVSSYSSGFSPVKSYNMQPAVIYKNVLNKYYALTYFDSDIFTTGSTYSIFLDDTTKLSASLYKYDSYNKLAIIEFNSAQSLSTVSLPSLSYEPVQGTRVFTDSSLRDSVSSFSSYDFIENTNQIYQGVISRYGTRLLMHTAMASSRNYGSGLYDYDGNLIGINVDRESSLGSNYLAGMNYAIYGGSLTKIVSDMESSSSTLVGTIRIDLKGLSYKLVYSEDYVDFPDGVNVGIMVNSTPSAFKSLRSGDLITKVNGEVITSIDVLQDACYTRLSSEKVTLEVYRESGTSYIKLDITN